jgi:hypothetical protein
MLKKDGKQFEESWMEGIALGMTLLDRAFMALGSTRSFTTRFVLLDTKMLPVIYSTIGKK